MNPIQNINSNYINSNYINWENIKGSKLYMKNNDGVFNIMIAEDDEDDYTLITNGI